MNRILLNALGAVALLVLCVVGWAAWQIGSTAKDVHAGLTAMFPSISKGIVDTFDNLNRPCAPGPCGLLPNGAKVETKVGDAIVTTQIQERAIAPHTLAAMDSFKTAADRLSGTADAGTDSLKALTATLGTAQTTIRGFQAPVASFTRAGDSLNYLLKDEAIYRTLDNMAGVTENAEGILADGRKVTDKLTKDYMTPVPWWKRPIKYFGTTWDILGAVARHTP